MTVEISVSLALLNPSCDSSEEHEIVREHAEHEFPHLRGRAAGGEGAAQAPLEAAEDTLDLGAVAIAGAREAPREGPAVAAMGQPRGVGAAVQGHHDTRDGVLAVREREVVLRVVARIGEWSSERPYPPPPGFSPPWCTLLTVAQARRSASRSESPRRS